MTERKIAIWTAVSTEEQARKYSLDAQLADCRAYVDSIPARYGDRATIVQEIAMADTRSIIEFSEAVRLYPNSYGVLEGLIKGQQINVLLCVRRDRLGREDSLVITIEALCRKYGVKIIAIKSSLPSSLDYSDDEGSSYVAAIEAVSARVEVKRLQDRRHIGMVGRVEDKRLFPNKVNWGYSYEYSPTGDIAHIVMDKSIQVTVRKILVDLYLTAGYGTPAIRDILNAEGSTSPRGFRWTEGGIRSIIMRARIYGGWIKYNSKQKYVQVKGDYEPMITPDELMAIEQEFKERGWNQQRGHNILSGVVLCAGCNQAMYHNVRHLRGKRKSSDKGITRCNRPNCTDQTSIRDHVVIKAIYNWIEMIEQLDDTDLVQFASQSPVDISPSQARVDGLKTEQGKLQAERKRVVHAYITLGLLSDDEFAGETERIEKRLSSLEKELSHATELLQHDLERNQALERILDIKRSGKSVLDTDNEASVNQWLRSRIRVIVKSKKHNPRIHIINL